MSQYGAFDLIKDPQRSALWGDRNLVLSGPIIDWFGDQFLPAHDREQRRDPDISPLYRRPVGACRPAIFTVGTQDALLDDTLFMEARWRTAGADTELRVYEEAAHGFTAFPLSVSVDARQQQFQFLRSV